MAKTAKKKTAKATLARKADSYQRNQRDLLARNVRMEKRILALAKSLRRSIQRRDQELQILRDAISIYRGEMPPSPVTETPADDTDEASHG